QRGECADAYRDTISSQHAHKFRDVLGFVCVHDGLLTMFQSPAGAARLEHDSISAQLVDAYLHRRARAQTWIEKNQRDRLPRQGLCVRATLAVKRAVDQLIDLLARKVFSREKMHPDCGFAAPQCGKVYPTGRVYHF